jgi:GDP/UDP-N,N'-diacetylbacillosamine 2-epimerase (hydrolysing)
LRRVLAVTGIRSEYFLARPIFRAIANRADLSLQLVVTGAHLSPLHDWSVRTIEADGFPIVDRIESLFYSDRDAARLKGAASQLGILAHVVDRERPDWLLAIADREEAMAVALCGAYMNIPVAHYGAGDRVVGNVDDMIRHAVSRLSQVLLTLSEDARERLIKSGEQDWRVHFVGHSGIDRLRETPVLGRDQLARSLAIASLPDRYAVVVQHPLSTEIDAAAQQMRVTLDALEKVGLPALVSYPNSDAGRDGMIAELEKRDGKNGVIVFPNIPDPEFVNLLRNAAVLVGNSSSGIMEAPFLKLPVVNVGRRQTMRLHAENVFFVPHEVDPIVNVLRQILQDPDTIERVRRCSNPFGDGTTGERVAGILAETAIDRRLMDKELTF